MASTNAQSNLAISADDNSAETKGVSHGQNDGDHEQDEKAAKEKMEVIDILEDQLVQIKNNVCLNHIKENDHWNVTNTSVKTTFKSTLLSHIDPGYRFDNGTHLTKDITSQTGTCTEDFILNCSRKEQSKTWLEKQQALYFFVVFDFKGYSLKDLHLMYPKLKEEPKSELSKMRSAFSREQYKRRFENAQELIFSEHTQGLYKKFSENSLGYSLEDLHLMYPELKEEPKSDLVLIDFKPDDSYLQALRDNKVSNAIQTNYQRLVSDLKTRILYKNMYTVEKRNKNIRLMVTITQGMLNIALEYVSSKMLKHINYFPEQIRMFLYTPIIRLVIVFLSTAVQWLKLCCVHHSWNLNYSR